VNVNDCLAIFWATQPLSGHPTQCLALGDMGVSSPGLTNEFVTTLPGCIAFGEPASVKQAQRARSTVVLANAFDMRQVHAVVGAAVYTGFGGRQ
jgi:hypothetical protein